MTRRSYWAAMFLREAAIRDALALTDPAERTAALVQVDVDHPKPTVSTYRRNSR